MASVFYAATTFKLLDLSDPTATPSGARFMPSSPPPEPSGDNPPIEAWSEDLDREFAAHLALSTNRYVLTSRKRADIQWHLSHPNAPVRGSTPKEKAKDQNIRQQSRSFEVRDNQVYRRAEKNKKTGEMMPARYAACT